MRISATVSSNGGEHVTGVSTEGRHSALAVAARPDGTGSSINGGELLCLALATCYCNDLHREAALRGIRLTGVEVRVETEFGGPGEPARLFTYSARVESDVPAAEIEALLRHTDRVAEVQNTLRAGAAVELRTQGAEPGT
jgi:uncharacterized OsmC-like protein